jgi:glucose-6-phosphate isomerase
MNSSSGISFSAACEFEPLSQGVLDAFERWMGAGRLGFMDLPSDLGLLQASESAAAEALITSRTMITAGIGGSSLGLHALLSGLSPDGGHGVFVADSPDSSALRRIASGCRPDSTALTVVTKSGSTAETLAIFMWLYRWLSSGTADPDRRVTAVTDPVKGDLRKLAVERGWRTLPVPPAVGGRFSALSPVGIYPAAFAGIDTGGLLEGAARISHDFLERGAGSLAGTIAAGFLMHFESKPVHVFFPYDDRLFDTALWFAQLWAESLGKARGLDGAPRCTGQTPLACRGPADQHSLVQLFMEGPQDKTVTIVTAGTGSDPAGPLPGGFSGYGSMAYLEGSTPDTLRKAESEATAAALEERGVPVGRIHLETLDAGTLGGLMMALEIATVLAGLAIGVDPLDQPGVERGKVLTYKAMGRPGY